ncbi:hypothetical protein KDA11_05715 [Candidatus Saccharibacteria bacterium]|nr:hypothetical protein [Candidatus Saccharibacteria bacterium]
MTPTLEQEYDKRIIKLPELTERDRLEAMSIAVLGLIVSGMEVRKEVAQELLGRWEKLKGGEGE